MALNCDSFFKILVCVDKNDSLHALHFKINTPISEIVYYEKSYSNFNMRLIDRTFHSHQLKIICSF